MKRLDNLQACLEDILRSGVPGDIIEAGTWRGGAAIFLRAILKAHGIADRSVWVADSFEGLPSPDFAVLAVALVFIGRRVYGSLERAAPPPSLSRAHALVGKEFFLDKAIERGYGAIRVDDSIWRVAGADTAAGAKVRVVSVEDSGIIRVERA